MIRERVLTSDPLDTIKRCGCHYEAVTDSEGNFLTPLVVTGSYEIQPNTGVYGSLVSPVYFDLAPLEQQPRAIHHFCRLLKAKVVQQLGNDRQPGDEVIETLIIVPKGGVIFGTHLALHLDTEYVETERRIVRAATEIRPAVYEPVFKRHKLAKGRRVAIVDDVGKDFTVFYKLLTPLAQLHCQIVAFICVINRSQQTTLALPCHGDIPVISLIHYPAPQYRQDHPIALEAFKRGNVWGDPKGRWDRLLSIMRQHAAAPA